MFPAALIQIVIMLLIAGVVLWGIEQLPLDATIRNFIRVAVIVVVAIWLIVLLAGLLGYPIGAGGASYPYRR